MEATTSQIQKMDRRTFLKATGITTSGLVLGIAMGLFFR
jgi:hypothetical protein